MKLKSLFYFFFIIVVFQSAILAQSSSSYSRIGIGDIINSYSGRRAAIGQIGTSLIDDANISVLNPASLTGLFSTRTEFGMNYTGSFLSNSSITDFNADTKFSGVTIAFPLSVKNGISLALGLLPVSNINYLEENSFASTADVPNGYNITYQGTGGLSKLFAATSLKFPFDLRFGITLDYYFGKLDYFSKIDFINDISFNSSSYDSRYRPHGFGSTIGIITPDISKMFGTGTVSNLRLGASISLTPDLLTDNLLIANSLLGEDTLSSFNQKMKIPYRLYTGFSFMISEKYLITFDYVFQPWSKYSLDGQTSAFLRDNYKISSGFEYRPERSIGQSFWEQLTWRAGLSFEQTQYNINGHGIDEYSVMGGLSIPLSFQNSLDFSIEYAKRGTKDFNLQQENLIRLNVGISLGELWFIRNEQF